MTNWIRMNPLAKAIGEALRNGYAEAIIAGWS